MECRHPHWRFGRPQVGGSRQEVNHDQPATVNGEELALLQAAGNSPKEYH
jgi:hypothetical protein